MPRGRLVTLAPALLVLAGCGSKQDSLAPQSPDAHGIATLWWIMFVGAAIGLALVAALLIASWVKRRESAASDRPATMVVLGLGIAVPIAILASLFVYSDIFLIRDTSPPVASAATGALQVRVIGHQFWWEVRYPGSRVVTANEIHIPVRTNVEVLVHTDDVIHSFWVPQLNRKIDLLPEQVNRVDLYADKVGRYRGQCAEFCGLQHAHMGFYVFADPPAVFRRWLRAQAKPAAHDLPLFTSECAECHAIRGTSATSHVGPDLTHVGSRTSLAALTIPNTPAHMREWLRRTQDVKPGAEMPQVELTDAQVNRLAAYLESLK